MIIMVITIVVVIVIIMNDVLALNASARVTNKNSGYPMRSIVG